MARQTFTSGQVLTAAQMTTLQASVWEDDVNAQTGTSYTLVIADAGKQVTMNNAVASTLTVPTNTVAFAVGTVVKVIQLGAGAVTITPAGGVTFTTPYNLVGGNTSFPMSQYQVATLIKQATNTWVVSLGTRTPEDDQNILSSQIFS